MDPRLEQSPPGAPEMLTGSASQEGSRRLLRSQPRRLGFGQPRQARPGEAMRTLPSGSETGPQDRNFLLWREEELSTLVRQGSGENRPINTAAQANGSSFYTK